jgi:hypothetical protein
METVVILIFLPLLAVAEFFLVEKRIEKEKLNARYLPLLKGQFHEIFHLNFSL